MSAVDRNEKAGALGRVGPLLASTGISLTGDGAFMAAAPLLAATLTRNPLEVSAATAAFYAPWLLVGLPAGALADRWPRRLVMIIADLVRAAILAVLAAAVATGHGSIALLVVTILVVGAAQCFFDASAQAVIPALVGRDRQALAHANGRYWSLDTVGRSLAGPPIGSAAFTMAKTLPFAADAVSFIASALFIGQLPHIPAADGPRQSVPAAIRAGLRHLRATRELRLLAANMAAYNFAYNVAAATFVLYATEILDVAQAGYGLLLAAGAVGGIISSWRAAALTRAMSYRQVMSAASLVQGLAWLAIVLVPNVYTTAVVLALMGAASTLTSVAVSSARQELTPDALLGRVVSAFRLFGTGTAAIGALIGGLVARTGSLRTPLWLAVPLLLTAAVAACPRRRQTKSKSIG